jgi:phosphopantetheinyl transferase (holo-ACP synthase)
MMGTGNDIVSLDAINITRTIQPAFYSKILADEEITYYRHNCRHIIPLENYVWLLWSVKESAYKYLQRFNPGLKFTPIKFIVSGLCPPILFSIENFNHTKEGKGFDAENTWGGVVTYVSNTLYFKSIIYTDVLLSAVNSTENFNHVYWGLQRINNADPANQSAAVRTFLLNKLHQVLTIKNSQIGKNEIGIPVLLKRDKEIQIAISLSHHEFFVGYSFVNSVQL